MGSCDGCDVIQKIELEKVNKLLEEADISPVDALPVEKKPTGNAKRIGIAALVTAATVLGYYFSRPLPVQQKEEKRANVYVLGDHEYALYTESSKGENLKIFSQGKLEYDLYDYNADGKVDEIFSPPELYLKRGSLLPPHVINQEILLKNADELWNAIMEYNKRKFTRK